MSYHGYIPHIQRTLMEKESPYILEIGVDRGTTLVPVTMGMTLCGKEDFLYLGIDVLLQEHVKIALAYIPGISLGLCESIDQTFTLEELKQKGRKILLVENNSIVTLPAVKKFNLKFDVILIDGDHNYHTVNEELKHVDSLLADDGMIIIDDYAGRWADKDLWYSQRPEYIGVDLASKPVESEKHGVKIAVDEFLSSGMWDSTTLMQGEPIVLTRKKQ